MYLNQVRVFWMNTGVAHLPKVDNPVTDHTQSTGFNAAKDAKR